MQPSLRIAAAVLLAAVPPAQAQVTALVSVNVVDVRAGTVRTRATVLIQGPVITAITPDSVPIPPGARRIDAQGGFLIPGLADMHAHFTRPEDLTVFLAYGVTLVQYLNASAELLDWRDSVASGRVLGPELHPCQGAIVSVDSVAQALRVVADAAADGFDCIKPYDRISDAAFRALAHPEGQPALRTVAHIPRNLTWQQALAARPSAIAHAEEFLYSPITTDLAVDTIATTMRESHIALVTTLTTYDLITRQAVELPELLRMPELGHFSAVHRRMWVPRWNHYAHDFTPAQVPRLRRSLVFQRELIRRLDSAGVRILAGTDVGNLFTLPGSSLHDELVQLVLSGLTPAAALRAATLTPAQFLGRDAELGTVEEGKRADLVLLLGNPLRDITNTRLISGVMRNGRWFPRDSLRAMLDRVRAKYAAESRFLGQADRLGIGAALAGAARERYHPDQRALNELAYEYWRVHHDTASAAYAFRENARLYPADWIALGSLGEWQEFMGDTAAARRSTEASLRGHPRDRELLAQLARIKAGPPKKPGAASTPASPVPAPKG